MSRHRLVRNIKLDSNWDEEEALSDGGEDDMTPEQHAQLATAASAVRAILGSEEESSISDATISDTVWNYFFDVEKSVDTLLKERNRIAAAKERKAVQASNKQKALTPQKPRAETAQTPKKPSKGISAPQAASSSTASASGSSTQKPQPHLVTTRLEEDMANLGMDTTHAKVVGEQDGSDTPIPLARVQLLEQVTAALESAQSKPALSLVVVGHVDAGKSTLMGRLLYDLGRVDERRKAANERASAKMGKSSFSWAWEMDGTAEERERGVTMDIALQTLPTPSRQITILDAPGHRDFIPNMISGAAQADAALLVVDSSTGEFESGFDRGGQTREHMVLVRSLGVNQVIVAVNKLDTVDWDEGRYQEICDVLKAFLVQAGFSPKRTKFVPVAATMGVNLVRGRGDNAPGLRKWYHGPCLVDLLDELEAPQRNLDVPLRIPLSNVFRGRTSSSSGIGVSGRIMSGVLQAGERLRVVPGDESATVRLIEYEETSVPWAVAGSNVTLYLTNIDPIQLSIGSVLCPPKDLVPLASAFEAKIMIFDIQKPIVTGAAVELFSNARETPATITKLISIIDRVSGAVTKQNPRVLQKSTAAIVQITLRSATMSGTVSRGQPIPLESFDSNKELGRVLLRSGGETIAAGIVTRVVV